MPADAALVAPLREVQEPELRRSIVELGMVKGAVLERGTALVAVALPLAPPDGGDDLRRRVIRALHELVGVLTLILELIGSEKFSGIAIGPLRPSSAVDHIELAAGRAIEGGEAVGDRLVTPRRRDCRKSA